MPAYIRSADSRHDQYLWRLPDGACWANRTFGPPPALFPPGGMAHPLDHIEGTRLLARLGSSFFFTFDLFREESVSISPQPPSVKWVLSGPKTHFSAALRCLAKLRTIRVGCKVILNDPPKPTEPFQHQAANFPPQSEIRLKKATSKPPQLNLNHLPDRITVLHPHPREPEPPDDLAVVLASQRPKRSVLIPFPAWPRRLAVSA